MSRGASRCASRGSGIVRGNVVRGQGLGLGRGRGWKGSWWEGGVRSSPTAKTSHAGIGVFCVTATCVAPPCAAPPCAAPPSAASSCAVPLCATPYCAARMQLVQCLNMPTVVFSQRSLFVSLQLELHLLMVHLLMVHLPMVHLHVLHLLAMHLIGLQLVQCIDTPTVVFRLQLIMHHCNLVDPSKGWRRASGEEKNSWRHSCLGHQHPRLGARAEHHYHMFPWSWTLFPQVSTFGTTMSYHIWDNHVEYFML